MINAENLTPEEERTNAILHGIGVGLSIAALAILVVFGNIYGDAWHVVSFSVYGASLILLYLVSTLYHSWPQTKIKNLLRILDHSSIYVLIAGTYTPLALISLRGILGWTIFGIIWGLAIGGILFKVYTVEKYSIFSTLLYITMGWLIVFAINPLLKDISVTSIIFLITGGLLYTIGTIFFGWKKYKYHHAIWHLFVLAGSICHFFTMLFLVLK